MTFYISNYLLVSILQNHLILEKYLLLITIEWLDFHFKINKASKLKCFMDYEVNNKVKLIIMKPELDRAYY